MTHIFCVLGSFQRAWKAIWWNRKSPQLGEALGKVILSPRSHFSVCEMRTETHRCLWGLSSVILKSFVDNFMLSKGPLYFMLVLRLVSWLLPMTSRLRSSSVTVDSPHPNPGSLTRFLSNSGQVPQSFCDSISSSVKWDLFLGIIVRIKF